jgi:DNA-binding LacI/PurR family transcriptional regulator
MTDPHPRRNVTQRDIAAAMGLNHSTVSLALRGSPKVSQKRRLEIEAKAREMGYQLNAAATTLARFRRGSKEAPPRSTIAWLNSWEDPEQLYRFGEFRLYWEGAQETVRQLGYHLEEFVINQKMTLRRIQTILETRGINGILIPPHKGNTTMSDFDWGRFSVLRFGRSVADPAANLVTADHVHNAMLAFREVRRRGYQRIGLVTDSHTKFWYLFDAGFLHARQEVPKAQRLPVLHADAENITPEGSQQLVQWLEREQPDAIITTLSYLPEHLESLGYQLPDDLGIAVMSVLDGCADAGIYQHSKEIGRVAAFSLISQIQANEKGIPPLHRETLIKGDWVHGKSLPGRQ